MLFVGGPSTRITNPRWRDGRGGRRLGKIENSPYLSNGLNDRHRRLKIRKLELRLGIGYDYGWQVLTGTAGLCHAFTTPHHTTVLRPFSETTWVSRCQKRTSGLYGARED